MKADKLFLEFIGHYEVTFPGVFDKPKPSQTEYIRKGAILDFLKTQKKECGDIIKHHPEDESVWAEMHWYEALIEKVNSL